MHKIKNLQHTSKMLLAVFAVAVIVVGSNIGLLSAQSVLDIQRQIEQLSEEISSSEDRIDELRDREDTLENRLKVLDAEIAQARAEIAETEREIAQTREAIEQKEKELQRTKELIQENVKVLYKQGSPSTLEILFSSENFTDFINRQEYLDRVKASLNEAARESVEIKEQLLEQEEDLEALQVEQESQRSNIEARIAQQQQLLEETRGEEARYQELVAEQRESLEAAQKELAQQLASRQSNVVSGGTGGYPYADVSPWSFNMCYGDEWGMCKRHCTSYVAWRVHQDYLAGNSRFDMPNWGGRGNAYEWITNAENANIPTGTTPKPGAVAVDPNIGCSGGTCYGHVMYVEEVLNSTTVRISQYNAETNSAGEFTGTYSQATVNTGGLTFIYFQEW